MARSGNKSPLELVETSAQCRGGTASRRQRLKQQFSV